MYGQSQCCNSPSLFKFDKHGPKAVPSSSNTYLSILVSTFPACLVSQRFLPSHPTVLRTKS